MHGYKLFHKKMFTAESLWLKCFMYILFLLPSGIENVCHCLGIVKKFFTCTAFLLVISSMPFLYIITVQIYKEMSNIYSHAVKMRNGKGKHFEECLKFTLFF